MKPGVLPPSPQTTLVILLGASEWPLAPDFQESEAFSHSAQKLREYFLDARQFDLPHENLLDLFNSDKSSDDIDLEICQFLDRHIAEKVKAKSGSIARDVLVYFVGHGGFAGGDSNYYLAIKRTRKDNPKASSIEIGDLAQTLKEKARFQRRILILDCCFAASASKFFQGSEPAQTAILQTVEVFKEQGTGSDFPGRGTSLLCSSRHNVPSLITPDNSYTMFSQALLYVLHTGAASREAALSLRTVARLAEDFLRITYTEAPRPEVHSPDQSEGDIASIPFFPNFGAMTESLIGVDIDTPKNRSTIFAHPSEFIDRQKAQQKKRRLSLAIVPTLIVLGVIGLLFSTGQSALRGPSQNSQNSRKISDSLELSYSTIQSKYWVFSGDPKQYSSSHLPTTHIGAMDTNGHTSDPLYSLFFELHYSGGKYSGLVIDKVQILIQQMHQITQPIMVWDPGLTSTPTHYASHLYEALYLGPGIIQAISINHNYNPISNDIFILPSGDTDSMEVHIISRIEADIVFSVKIMYHFYSERQDTHMLIIPTQYEVTFINSSGWRLYHLQDNYLVPEK
jgi:hypothetical protein